ncbi:MAG: hypothetical protein AB3N14_07785 [Flavobacteriaceae bacterium]
MITTIAENAAKYRQMRDFSLLNFKDGWEIWLQCEAYFSLPNSKQYEYDRGTQYPYPYNKQKCDFLITRNGVNLWLEAKVLLREDIRSLVKRFISDLTKIDAIDLNGDTNSIGAFAVAPLMGEDLFTQDIKDLFRDTSPVDIDKIEYLAVQPNLPIKKGKYNSTPELTKGDIIILYYVRL